MGHFQQNEVVLDNQECQGGMNFQCPGNSTPSATDVTNDATFLYVYTHTTPCLR